MDFIDENKIIKDKALKDSADRAITLSYFFSLIFYIYGFSSLDFIQRYNPSVTLWDNTWPRFIFNSLPLILLGYGLKKSKISDSAKLLIWITGFSCIVHASAWIYVWPTTLHISAEAIIFVNAANVFLIAALYAIITPPGKLLWMYGAILTVLFIIPLLIVCYVTGDMIILKTVGSDISLAIFAISFLSKKVEKLRFKVSKLEFEKEQQASKFLGPIVAQAIYNNRPDRLSRIRCKGFVISIDIRDSTDLQQQYGQSWHEFRLSYFSFVSSLIKKHGGYLQKTVGDCHVINFGVMDYGIDLSDIPGIENELDRSEDRRLQSASLSAFDFLDELLSKFSMFAKETFPEKEIQLGAGIDKGWLERSVQGDESALELDVNGDPVNCSNRLQEYSKHLLLEGKVKGSVLVVSPFASDYLPDLNKFECIQTLNHPVRNYSKIPWVLVRSYSNAQASIKKAA